MGLQPVRVTACRTAPVWHLLPVHITTMGTVHARVSVAVHLTIRTHTHDATPSGSLTQRTCTHHSHRTGCDFVFIDLERCAIDHTTLSWMCQTYGAMGVAPVVRIAAAESKEARQCKASQRRTHTHSTTLYCTHTHTPQHDSISYVSLQQTRLERRCSCHW